MNTVTTAIINLSAIRHNLDQIKQLAPESKVMSVIKADAYGHGLLDVAHALDQADGLAVARLEEAIQLRKAGITLPVLLLAAPMTVSELEACAANNIGVVIHNLEGVALLDKSRFTTPLWVWLKLDTGMHRLGLTPDEFKRAELQLRTSNNVSDMVLMTHFSSAEDDQTSATDKQLQLFENTVTPLKHPQSLANSAAILKHPHTQKDWIRPGIALYGASPFPSNSTTTMPIKLQAAMTLKTKIIAIRQLEFGESVGYNERWTATKKSLIATLGIGYGDGYPRHARNGTPVIVNGQRATVVGTVSMDLISIDISDCENIALGDTATLWGDGLPAEEIASYADTISYELFTSITKRVPRTYVDD